MCSAMLNQEARAKPNLELEKDSRGIKPNSTAPHHPSGTRRPNKGWPQALAANPWHNNAKGLRCQRPNPPTAILRSNDLTAIGAMVAIHEAGLRVPQDMSVVGFDDIQLCVATYPPLTTISLSREMLGGLAFEALTKLLHSKRKRGAEYIVGTKLIVRLSTTPPPLPCQHPAGSQRGSCNGILK